MTRLRVTSLCLRYMENYEIKDRIPAVGKRKYLEILPVSGFWFPVLRGLLPREFRPNWKLPLNLKEMQMTSGVPGDARNQNEIIL